MRPFFHLTYLSQSHSLYLVTLTQFDVENEALDKLMLYFKDTVVIPNSKNNVFLKYMKSLITCIPYKVIHYTSPKAEQAIQSMIKKYDIDILLLDYFFTASERIKNMKVKKCLLAPNLEYVLLKRYIQYGNINKKIYGFTQWRSLRRLEVERYSYFDKVIFISKHDERQIKNIMPEIDSDIIEGGIDIVHFTSKGIHPCARATGDCFDGSFVLYSVGRMAAGGG